MYLSKIGVLAGVFDPLHKGHLKFIEETSKKYGLDKVLIIIEKNPQFKKTFVDYKDRKKIAELSIKNLPKVQIYAASSDYFPLSSTLPKIKSEFGGRIYLLMGEDVAKHIQKWPGSKQLLEGMELVVAERRGNGYKQVSSGKVREQMKKDASEVDMQKDALDYCLENKLYV